MFIVSRQRVVLLLLLMLLSNEAPATFHVADEAVPNAALHSSDIETRAKRVVASQFTCLRQQTALQQRRGIRRRSLNHLQCLKFRKDTADVRTSYQCSKHTCPERRRRYKVLHNFDVLKNHALKTHLPWKSVVLLKYKAFTFSLLTRNRRFRRSQ